MSGRNGWDGEGPGRVHTSGVVPGIGLVLTILHALLSDHGVVQAEGQLVGATYHPNYLEGVRTFPHGADGKPFLDIRHVELLEAFRRCLHLLKWLRGGLLHGRTC